MRFITSLSLTTLIALNSVMGGSIGGGGFGLSKLTGNYNLFLINFSKSATTIIGMMGGRTGGGQLGMARTGMGGHGMGNGGYDQYDGHGEGHGRGEGHGHGKGRGRGQHGHGVITLF